MSSPGSGKTTTLLRTIDTLAGKYRMGIMEADIDSSVDAKTGEGVEAWCDWLSEQVMDWKG